MDPEGGHGVPPGSAPWSTTPITRATPPPVPRATVPHGSSPYPAQRTGHVHQASFGFNVWANSGVRYGQHVTSGANSGVTVVSLVVSR